MFSHRIREENSRQMQSKLVVLGDLGTRIAKRLEAYTGEVAEALHFLYASMPLSDCVEYDVSLFETFASHGLFLRENIKWCADLPEELFQNYVLHHRVNNEELVACRRFFFDSLEERIQGLTMRQAILEANYWCAEHVAYQATDIRTVSPLAVWRSARGRCGEESTFTVHVLRALGIPARQVYVPRWSHCDDNHAWVEVWCEGEWHYLGACEPEEELNRGWFTGAASRAMLVHSRQFASYTESFVPETITERMGCSIALNQLARYANIKKLRVTVYTPDNKPAVGASVRYEVFNYAELFPIAKQKTNAQGVAELETGWGSVHIGVNWQEYHAKKLVSPKETEIELFLHNTPPQEETWQSMDFIPPAESLKAGTVLDPEVVKRGKEKLKLANAKRKAKEEAFSSLENIESLCKRAKNPQVLRALLQESRGNVSEIAAFLRQDNGEYYEQKIDLLLSLPQKDLTDCKAEVLLAHLLHALPFAEKFPQEIFVPYLLCPRIRSVENVSTEPLRAWREEILQILTPAQQAEYLQNPTAILAYVNKQVQSWPGLSIPSLVTTPAMALSSGTGSEMSRRLLLIAIARTLGIPARLREEDGAPEYYCNGQFHLWEEPEQTNGLLQLLAGDEKWQYQRNWSLAKHTAAEDITLDLSKKQWKDGKMNLELVAGEYRIYTCNRLTSGAIWAYTYYFTIQKEEKKTIQLLQREVNAGDMLEDKQVEAFTLSWNEEELSSCKLAKESAAFFWLQTGEEPTEHILNELLEHASYFAKQGPNVVLVVEQEKMLANETLQAVLRVLPEATVCIDTQRQAGKVLARRMYRDPDTLPFILVLDKKHTGVYSMCGYNVGTVDLVSKIWDLVK